VDNADAKLLRQLAVQLQTQLAPAAIFLAGGNAQAVFAAAATKGGPIDAKEWVAHAAAIANASGGGKADFAQAGGGDINQRQQALAAARAWVSEKITG
nr:alanine--tRNA ligase [Pseudomonadota bacterium]